LVRILSVKKSKGEQHKNGTSQKKTIQIDSKRKKKGLLTSLVEKCKLKQDESLCSIIWQK
jgi:hypothetical protein